MTENKSIEIALSKSKLTKLLVFSILFLIAGAWILISNPQTGNPLFNNPFMKAVASYGGMAMGLLGVYFFGRKLLDDKPGLVIDEKGIYDNTSAFHFGLISWNDISQISGRTVQVSVASKQQFITIELFNPEKYIAAEKNALKRKLLLVNASQYGSPVHISTNGLATNHNELLQMLTDEFNRHKGQNRKMN